MKLHRLPLFVALTATLLGPQAGIHAQTTVATDPVGFTTISVTPGASGARKQTLMSIPLLEVDPSVGGLTAGTITSVLSNRITVTNAGWTPGNLSKPAEPFVVQITSGSASGRLFLIASSSATNGSSGGAALANSATNLFISSLDMTPITNNLANAGVEAGNTFKIYACNTLSWFGTPASTGIRGGTNLSSADNVIVTVNGSASTYFFNTSRTNWVRLVGTNSVGSENVALHPSYGVTYSRLGTNALSFISTGEVPTIANRVAIKNSGTTILSSYYPTTNNLRGLGIQSLPGWVIGTNQTSTDNVVVVTSGNAVTYFYNGTNWRRQNIPSSMDNIAIPIGSSVQVIKKGSAAGYSTLARPMNYSLN